MDSIQTTLVELLGRMGVQPESMGAAERAVVLAGVLAAAFLAGLFCRRMVVPVIRKLTAKTQATWDDHLFSDAVLRDACRLVPPVVLFVLLPFAFPREPGTLSFLLKLCSVYVTAAAVRLVCSFLSSLYTISSESGRLRNHPLKGVYQMLKIVVIGIGAILVLGALTGKDPAGILAGLGASAAILMLVFRDTILGLVAGVQLSANDMLRPGDWITMPKYGADGTVAEVTLTTVKVRNWDNTLVTVPPYALVSDSFQNWRGMRESGGRRVKRSLPIDMNTVRFCTPEEQKKWEALLDPPQAPLDPPEGGTNDSLPLGEVGGAKGTDNSSPFGGVEGAGAEGAGLVNLRAFRDYVERYLRRHPGVNGSLAVMVRQLQPTPEGLPLELYFFSADKDWAAYERLQAEVFDHLLAVLPLFGLRVFQRPAGSDVRSLGSPRA